MARRLKNGEAVAAEEHDNVTILFCDIVGFTAMSSSVGALSLPPPVLSYSLPLPHSLSLIGSVCLRLHFCDIAGFTAMSSSVDVHSFPPSLRPPRQSQYILHTGMS